MAVLLADLAQQGVRVFSEGGRLMVDGPAALVTAGLQARLRRHQADLMAHLAGSGLEPRTAPLGGARVEVGKDEVKPAELLARLDAGMPVADTEVIAALSGRHVEFDERAGIMEYEGGMTRPEAEVRALEAVLVEWANRYPPEGLPADRCAVCGQPAPTAALGWVVFDDGALVHYSNARGGDCFGPWQDRRRQDAVRGLLVEALAADEQG